MPMEVRTVGWIEGRRNDLGFEMTGAWRQCDCTADWSGRQDGAEMSRAKPRDGGL
jgi:hypothetical protein